MPAGFTGPGPRINLRRHITHTQMNRSLKYFDRRYRRVFLGDTCLDISWSWTFKSLSISTNGQSILENLDRKSLKDGLTFRHDNSDFRLRSADEYRSGRPWLRVSKENHSDETIIVDFETHIAKDAMLMGALAMAYLLFSLWIADSSPERLLGICLFAVPAALALTPAAIANRFTVGALMLGPPVLFISTTAVLFLYLEPLPAAILSSSIIAWMIKDMPSRRSAWKAFCSSLSSNR